MLVVERAVAEVTSVRLYGDRRATYLVTVALGAEFGSYSGALTRLAEVRQGHLHWVQERDVHMEQDTELRLLSSLKTAWRLLRRRDGRGQEILLVACRPDVSALVDTSRGQQFPLIFVRYRFGDGRWRRYERTEPGCWESGDAFPERLRFP